MAFQLSPGVNVSEIDLTTIVPSVATSIGAFAGQFAWGPVGEGVFLLLRLPWFRSFNQTKVRYSPGI